MLTNFSLLTNNQKTVWSMELWKQARNYSFVNKFLGKGPNSIIQHITELKKSEKGARAVITLLADLVGDGVAGDRTLEGNEEGMQTFDQVIQIDQIRNANRMEGRMADQRSIVEFRGNSRNVLAYWLADRIDQMAFLTLSGVSYGMHNNGIARIGSDLTNLAFAGDVAAPTAARCLRWSNASQSLIQGATTSAIVATDTIQWATFVALKAYAKTRYIRGVTEDGGEETYHAFVTPQVMADLKLDPNYMQNLRYARDPKINDKLWSGATVKVDGIYLHEYRHVYNTSGAASGSKWGSGGLVDGAQVLFLGAQALGFADIGAPEWDEKEFDFGNQQAIATGKILGFLKPKFASIYESGTVQDFGAISCYVAQ